MKTKVIRIEEDAYKKAMSCINKKDFTKKNLTAVVSYAVRVLYYQEKQK